MRAAAMEAMEKQLGQVGCDHADREAIVAAVRQIVVSDVDARVQAKADELWQRGKQMLTAMQYKHKDKTEALVAEVAQCQQKQRQLESENEKLKEVLHGIAQRFSMLGAVFAQKATTNGMVDPCTAGSTNGSNQGTPGPAELFSPVFTPQAEATKLTETGASKLPDVPDFPFGSQAASPAPPISLAEALPPQSPQLAPQPLSLASTLTPPPSPGDVVATADKLAFTFTLRKADGADLGLNVSHHENDRSLRVEGVRPDGAVDAWNRQCSCSTFAYKTVLPGDTIVSVNGITQDPAKMLEECRDRQLLKLAIERQRNPVAAVANRPSTLRAEASVFVPQSPAPASDRDAAPVQEPIAETEQPTEGEIADTTEKTA
jgi:hypothetical protein